MHIYHVSCVLTCEYTPEVVKVSYVDSEQVAKQWDPELPGKCLNQVHFYYGLAGTSLGFDVIIIILPLPVLWRLQLGLKQKVASPSPD